MIERKPARMQELAAEGLVRNSVDRVSDDRQVDRGQVNPDLVRPAGLEPHVQQRVPAEQLGHLEVSHGLARRVGVERLPRRVVPVAADRRLDPSTPGARPAADERQVVALDLPARNQILKSLVGLVRARHDEEPGSVTVEPVDDPGPVSSPPPDRPDEAVDERSASVPRSRVHDDAGRLVDDQQMLVLVGDAEIDLLGLERLRRLRRQLHLDLLAALQAVALRPRASVHPHRAGRQQALGSRARADLRQLREEPVEAVARRLLRNAERGTSGTGRGRG